MASRALSGTIVVEGRNRGQVEVHLRHRPRVGNPGAGPKSHVVAESSGDGSSRRSHRG